jgi:peptidoglycan/xylan/chitin deacetylase (PgdA/CDA1 family)
MAQNRVHLSGRCLAQTVDPPEPRGTLNESRVVVQCGGGGARHSPHRDSSSSVALALRRPAYFLGGRNGNTGNTALGVCMVEKIKYCVLWAYVHIWAPCRNAARAILGRAHVVVIVYHRVSDDYKDSVTVGTAQFTRQMDILSRWCPVLDMDTFLSQRGKRRSKACAVITFDDGYADNYDASKILKAQSLPCTFFITTRIVGTDNAFPHDLKRLGHQVPTLKWPQIHEMAQWGFLFANHTAHHANLGKLSVAEAKVEVQMAMNDLRREIGVMGRSAWLAYPFGKPQDMRQEICLALREVGMECCFSAYGGTNSPDFDMMNILRQGVDHKFTDLAFKAMLEGWRVRN